MSTSSSATLGRWRSAPVVDVSTLIGDGPVLVLAPHADDETIGCGGLIRAAVRRGIPLAVDILTDGSRSHPSSVLFDRARLAALRRREAAQAVAVLGLGREALQFWDVEDSALAATEDLLAKLRQRIADVRPSTVLVTWVDDPHCDHQAAFALALGAAQASEGLRLLAYPVWSWTIETPRHEREARVSRLDIAADLALKRQALECHASQLGRVIVDDPEGFTLSAAEIALFVQPYETFIEVLREDA